MPAIWVPGAAKTVILSEKGRVISRAQQEYPTAYPQLGWVEQNPEDWYNAFCMTVRAALQKSKIDAAQIRAVGIVGVTHNTVLLDADDKPLCPSILLFDTRSTHEVETILEKWGDQVLERTLNDTTPVWSWPQLLWIRNHRPEVWQATRRLLFQKDYVRHRLAPSPVTDVIDAGGSLLFDPVMGEWIPEFCADLGVDPLWLPEVAHPLQVVSAVSQQGAEDTGLLAGNSCDYRDNGHGCRNARLWRGQHTISLHQAGKCWADCRCHPCTDTPAAYSELSSRAGRPVVSRNRQQIRCIDVPLAARSAVVGVESQYRIPIDG